MDADTATAWLLLHSLYKTVFDEFRYCVGKYEQPSAELQKILTEVRLALLKRKLIRE